MEMIAPNEPALKAPATTGKKILAFVFTKTNEMLEKCLESPLLRQKDIDENGNDKNKGSFTRERKLTADTIVQLVIKRIYKSLQLALDDIYEEDLRDEEGEAESGATKQAMSQARMKISPDYIRSYADMAAEAAVQEGFALTCLGLPVLAIDGSSAALENTEGLKRGFGVSGSAKNAATASFSTVFDVLNGALLDFQIGRYGHSERAFAVEHVKRLLELGIKSAILLFDRGYPAAWFIAFLIDSGFHFVMRVREKYSLEVDAVKTQKWISIEHLGKKGRIRVVKVKLKSGEIETLITTLNQKQLPRCKAGDAYFLRWKIETAYDIVKSKLELENFSGKKKITVLQDFYATMYIANLAFYAAREADAEVVANDEGKNLKNARKASRSRIIRKMRKHFAEILKEPSECVREKMLDRLIEIMAKFPVPIAPARASSERKKPRNKRYHMGRKSVVQD